MEKTIYSERYIKLVKWLKSERINRQISMRTLAEKLDVPHSFVSRIEQRERRLDVLEYVDYCHALSISPRKGLPILFLG